MIGDDQATRGTPRVALVTCSALPDLDPDDRLLLGPLADRGVRAVPVVWDDAGMDWSSVSLAVIRSTWDYPARRPEFTAWARTVPALANPADVLEWNTDKTYLDGLSRTLPTVPTEWIPPDRTWSLPPAGDYVIKPTISAGSRDTGRYDLTDPEHRAAARAHLGRLAEAGRTGMVQPYLAAVDTLGETALIYLADPDGLRFSHAIRKGPMLTGPDTGVEGLYLAEKIEARVPEPAEVELGDRVLAAVPGGPERLLYARVDLIPGPDSRPVLVELELTEPSLFLSHAPGAPDQLADAIAARLLR
ncbi:hypothetical protein ACFFWC_26615 [Plantactinospora siamensis]|uniref:ATP-grasp domain-containing protein n=1 Tax=Plantactinospora siamensis TaxID=555372 RepID=A0ABV6NZA6_9ACTN